MASILDWPTLITPCPHLVLHVEDVPDYEKRFLIFCEMCAKVVKDRPHG